MNLLQPVKGELTYDGIISQKFNDPYTPASLLAFYKSLGLDGHNGVDFSGSRGTPIYAAHDGLITYAQDCGNTGGLAIKLKGDGYFTQYFHNDQLLVSVGENVAQGQIIAKMGNSGSSPTLYMGVHCQFGLYFLNSDNSIKNYDNGFKGAIDGLPYMLNNNDMKKIIGDRSNNRQYVQGDDKKLHWIFGQPGQDSAILFELHEAGIIDKNQVEWHENLSGYIIGSPWGALK